MGTGVALETFWKFHMRSNGCSDVGSEGIDCLPPVHFGYRSVRKFQTAVKEFTRASLLLENDLRS